LSGGATVESLEERRPSASPELDDEASADFWLEQEDDPQTIEVGDLLQGHPGADGWDKSDGNGSQAIWAELLGKLPREQRQTLVLQAVEGFELGEVADIQGRSLDAVKADIEAARQTLWHQLVVEQELPDAERTINRPGGRDRRYRR
jgi:DNA-directed RNA polymerase specialized sigma24 family protein